ncbi:LCP family protein [Microcoleus sp. FACHB-1515]|uniref:LCP family protein n=1 Tax=Cyanophyceae TaxID=3028117 RepID=UPI0016896F1A|nr:LCP family protein [Microcoleus sp. FACHB-1515]MBD2093199.1 LCP family protein [Microcoleus sp. FACHB-1515]
MVWLMLGLGAVAISSATAGALLAMSLTSTPLLQSQLSPEDADVFNEGESISSDTNFRLPQLTRPVNILVLGIKVLTSDLDDLPESSRNQGYHALVNSFDGLSDTMLLLRFDPEHKQLSVLSLPRDTRTWVEGVGETKLNEANVHGGPALAATTTTELLGGVKIDRYVRINVQGVEKLIDALGGVTVYVPKDMQYQDDSQHLYIDLKQGEQHLDGNQALQFLRFRYDQNGDIGRIQRQQMMMRALQEQALSPATLTRLPQILSVIQSNIDTNLSVEELVALVGFAAQTSRSNVEMLMLPGRFSTPDQYSLSYWLPSRSRIETMMGRYFGLDVDSSAEESARSVRIAIQDSSDRPDAVDQLVNQLQAAGYSNVSVDRPWSEPLATTRVIAQQGDTHSADAVQEAIGLGEVRIESTGSLDSDVTIQLGTDWQPER